MNVEMYQLEQGSEFLVPYIGSGISAGFPSPALDYEDLRIDLNKELIKNPLSTFFGRVRGVSLQDAGVDDGDIMVIDKSIRPADGMIAVCYLDGEFTAKRIRILKDCMQLVPANPDYPVITVTADNDFVIWGIVTYIIKSV
ncbi:LexA family protein [Sphingobacterium paucimobilis]|uniref:UmuDC operon protein-like protein n=1 Tax=Sphingobacterium paucimobilis HER1398 TaxID=1346330 RepID=U2J7Q7_9SPHI|nr:translesion error-prone DNA polymerase V autoproteolytic subunit [Sphingobacterium paucimobilis]ERJ58683.1 umuDC operon protein-like protein [Sphingobacterium paucimobilis HER1398]